MIRVAITGPESSGKSTLAVALAEVENGVYVPEFARTYLEQNGAAYTIDDLEFMTIGHCDAVLSVNDSLVVVDTDFIGFKVWSEYKYDRASALIHQTISKNYFDLHILCAPDIPWEPDPLRENPNDRHILFDMFVRELERYKREYIIVYGSESNRLKKSCEAVRSLRRNV